MRGLLALALLVSGCATNSSSVAPITPALPVRQILIVSSALEWQRTPWYRSSDLSATGPFFVVLGEGDRACIVPAQTWAIVQTGQWHECLGGWRAPRFRYMSGSEAPQPSS